MSYCDCSKEKIRSLGTTYHELLPLINNTVQLALIQGDTIETTGNKNYSITIPIDNNHPKFGNITLTSRDSETLNIGTGTYKCVAVKKLG